MSNAAQFWGEVLFVIAFSGGLVGTWMLAKWAVGRGGKKN